MPNYVALLRGINVSGHRIIKMEPLRACFERLGFTKVASYLQSGNVIFAAGAESPSRLAKRIEEGIHEDTGFSVPVLLRSARELAEITNGNPLLEQPGIDLSKLHVTFLAGPAPAAAEESLARLALKPERFRVMGREIYLYCPNGYGRTKLSNSAIEKKLGLGATTRNWKSVNVLSALAAERAA
jgi:uncharacterized protein (DUF1697 family)